MPARNAPGHSPGLTEGLGGLEGSKNPSRDRDRGTGGTGCSFWPSHLRDAGGDVRRDPGSQHRGEEAAARCCSPPDPIPQIFLHVVRTSWDFSSLPGALCRAPIWLLVLDDLRS